MGHSDNSPRTAHCAVHQDGRCNDDNDDISESTLANNPTYRGGKVAHYQSKDYHHPKALSTQFTVTDSPLFEPMDDDSSTNRGLPDISRIPERIFSSGMAPSLDGLKRARAIKTNISANLSILQPKRSALRRVEEDPENQFIKTLRQDHKMGWDAIATYLNEERIKRGEPGNLTTPAVYSRFVRNGPRIAAALGEVGFDPKDYMHLRHPQKTPSGFQGGGDRGFSVGVGRKRVHDETTEEQNSKSNPPKKFNVSEQAAELEQEDMTELLIHAVAKVESRFWSFVAEELERSSARLYDPKVCESRFRAI